MKWKSYNFYKSTLLKKNSFVLKSRVGWIIFGSKNNQHGMKQWMQIKVKTQMLHSFNYIGCMLYFSFHIIHNFDAYNIFLWRQLMKHKNVRRHRKRLSKMHKIWHKRFYSINLQNINNLEYPCCVYRFHPRSHSCETTLRTWMSRTAENYSL